MKIAKRVTLTAHFDKGPIFNLVLFYPRILYCTVLSVLWCRNYRSMYVRSTVTARCFASAGPNFWVRDFASIFHDESPCWNVKFFEILKSSYFLWARNPCAELCKNCNISFNIWKMATGIASVWGPKGVGTVYLIQWKTLDQKSPAPGRYRQVA